MKYAKRRVMEEKRVILRWGAADGKCVTVSAGISTVRVPTKPDILHVDPALPADAPFFECHEYVDSGNTTREGMQLWVLREPRIKPASER